MHLLGLFYCVAVLQQVLQSHATYCRTYARLLHDAGVMMVAIQQNLGHATLETTLRYVGNLQIDQSKPPTILRPNMRWLTDGGLR